jgi:hypothetical protein
MVRGENPCVFGLKRRTIGERGIVERGGLLERKEGK